MRRKAILALVALAAVCSLALLPSRGPAGSHSKPLLPARVAKLERRVALLERQVTALRVLVCLQVPTC